MAMTRRTFVHAALAAPLAALGGCRLSMEAGVLSSCRVGHWAHDLVDAAFEGVRPERVWDMHVHLFGNGRSQSGIYVDPDFDRPRTPQGMIRRTFFMNGGCISGDDDRLDSAMVSRLAHVADEMPDGVKVVLLAFDFTHDETGRRREDLTTFAVPDFYARRVAALLPGRFEWIASVHPYRPDAIERLEAARAGGARAVKWLPPAMGINLASPRCRPFYEALRRLDLPLLTHVGEEQAVAGARREDLANPLALRHPLEAGVRVIAAHCATLGTSPDIDRASPDKAPVVANFELFTRLMSERRYEGLLFGDISAITQYNRAEHLPAIIARREWDGRLLNGSDYPLPGILPLFSPKAMVSAGLLDAALIPALTDLRNSNALLFDFVLKRNLRARGQRLPAAVFETRGFFERASPAPTNIPSPSGQPRVSPSPSGQPRVSPSPPGRGPGRG